MLNESKTQNQTCEAGPGGWLSAMVNWVIGMAILVAIGFVLNAIPSCSNIIR